MNALAGVVFHVDTRYADALFATVDRNSERAVLGQRLIVLGDLVALRQIRIEIVLARESRYRIDAATQGEAGADRHLKGSPVQDRKSARQSETDRANVSIRRRAIIRGASAKNLSPGPQLNVHFQANHRFVTADSLGRGYDVGTSG